MTSPATIFAERFLVLRRRVADNQRDFAERVGVSASTVSNWERGAQTPNVVELDALCRLFRISADFLIGRSDHPEGLRPGLFVVDEDKLEHRVSGDDWGWLLPTRCRYATHDEVKEIQRQATRKRRGT